MEFLLEIMTEELPSAHVRSALAQLEAKFRYELQNHQIGFRGLRLLGSCRRLVVTGDLDEGQPAVQEIVTGPPKAAGIAGDGSYSQAAKGFARSRGIPVESLEVIQTARGEYLGFRRIKTGRSTAGILRESIPQIIASLSFPKMMRWGERSLKFSRPIRALMCIFGEKTLPFSLDGLDSSDSTIGHTVHSPVRLRVKSFSEYMDMLAAHQVVIDPDERRRRILDQVGEKLAPLKAKLLPDEELLERLIYNTEFPLVFMGSFPEKYLSLPIEVLSTAMREGQRLFSVVKDKKQMPKFIGVADGPDDARSLIVKGNERVLLARLEDARFFWEHDMKVPLAERAAGLKNVVFQEKLGSYEDKVQRLKKVGAYLCDRADARKVKKDLIEAAGLCKADLLTDMVREFPALQGKMGGLYAKEAKRPPGVWQAIYEHYQPLSLDDDIPPSLTGALLSLVDKLDTVVGAIGIGTQVSGSSDPFGLRRAAHGVAKIIIDRRFSFSFHLLLDKTIAVLGDKPDRGRAETKNRCLDFFQGRLRFIYEKQGFRYDLINAALAPGIDNIYHSFLRVKALDALKSSPQFEPFILMCKRVNNILRGLPSFKVSPDLLSEKEERDLYSSFSIVRENVLPMLGRGDFAKAQTIIFKLQPCLNAFFDKVLVMAEDKKIRQNRLGLLGAVQKLLMQSADYSQIVVEGETSVPRKG